MNNNKIPGLDGFTSKVYKRFGMEVFLLVENKML
jgi:hypothetical protein